MSWKLKEYCINNIYAVVEKRCYVAQKSAEINTIAALATPRAESVSRRGACNSPFLCVLPGRLLLLPQSHRLFWSWLQPSAMSALRECSGPHLLLPSLKLTYFLYNDIMEASLGTSRYTDIFSEMTLLVIINIEEPSWWQKQYTECTRGVCTVVKRGKRRHVVSHLHQLMSKKSHGNLWVITLLQEWQTEPRPSRQEAASGSGTVPRFFRKSHYLLP